jgi:hypothetical protein
MCKEYFIYGLFDPRDLQLRYVGMTSEGPLARLYRHERVAVTPSGTSLSTIAWINGLPVGCRPLLLVQESCTSLKKAYAAEIEAIAYYRGIGVPLVNQGAGGPGPIGVKRSAETRALMGAAKRGVPKTEEHRRNLSKSGGGKPFKDDLGNVYLNIHEAGLRLGLQYQNIWKVLKGQRKHVNGRSFSYVE